ncbi:MAG: restriction endonuclease subunit S, partial [Marinomonas sp.]
MSELPKGWVKTTLGKVVDYGCTEKANIEHIDDNVWVLELEDIEKNSSKLLQRISFLERQPKSAKNSFKKGDVLYGKLRPYLNKIIIAPENGICTSEIIPLKTDESLINNYFLFYWLKGIEFCNYVNTVSYGVNMPRLGTKGGKNAPFTLAPLAEQKRIVEKLGDVLAQVGSIKARLDSIPAILKRFRQSVLAAAVSGELTEEWRGVNDAESVSIDHIENLMFEKGVTHGNFGRKLAKASAVEPEELKVLINHKNDWPLVRIGSICESVVPNRDKPKSFGGGYHWLLTPNFDEQNIHIDYSKIEYGLTLEETKKYKAKIIKSGNVVMTCI